MSSKFSCVTPKMEKLSLELLKNRECTLEVGCGGVLGS